MALILFPPIDNFVFVCHENKTLLINNTWPQFTECFMHTVLIWVPCAFVWLTLPLYISSINKQSKRTPNHVSLLNGARLFLCIALAVLTVLQLVHRTSDVMKNRSFAAFIGDGVFIATYLLLALMTQFERKKGTQASCIPFFFWLLLSLCNIIPFYTAIIKRDYDKEQITFALFVLSYGLQLSAFALTFFTEHFNNEDDITKNVRSCPLLSSSAPSFLVFGWVSRLMVTGYRRDLEEGDIWDLPREEKTETVFVKFQDLWQMEQQRQTLKSEKSARSSRAITGAHRASAESIVALRRNSPPDGETVHLIPKSKRSLSEENNAKGNNGKKLTPSVLRLLSKIHGKEFCLSLIMKVISDLILVLGPLLLGVLLSFLETRAEGQDWKGYVLCLSLFFIMICKALLLAHSMFSAQRLGIRMKSTLTAAVFHKTLTINSASRSNSAVGEIVNLMSVDAQRVLDLMQIFFVAVTTPIQVLMVITLLFLTIGPSVFAGVLFLVCLVPLNTCVIAKQHSLQKSNLLFKDARIKLYNEILNGIKVLKLYAWEPSFRDRIREIRLKEIGILLKIAVLNMGVTMVWDMVPYMMTLITLATYLASDQSRYLDAGTVFVALSLFSILQAPVSLIPSMLIQTVQANVSIKRINAFLLSDDLDPTSVKRDKNAEYAISVQDASFTWGSTSRPLLSNITLNVREGKLVALVGSVGCGKSSLISAILGEMEKIKGTVTTRGTFAYVPQQAWIQNASLRDNILFGKQYVQSRYKQTLRQCELETDLTVLAAGDLTEIGEKGINLSGGQKQRVSLARAVYSDSDIYLLDDPLSAVDSHVGKALFKHIIGPSGLLKGKTRLLVTNDVHWLPLVDEIIVMSDGKISERGSYEELIMQNGHFSLFLKAYLMAAVDSDSETDSEIFAIHNQMREKVDSVTSDGEPSVCETLPNFIVVRRSQRRKKRETIISPATSHTEDPTSPRGDIKVERNGQTDGHLTTLETVEKGMVSWAVFSSYTRAAGVLSMTLAFLSYCIYQALSVGSNFWLKIWTEDQKLLNASTFDREALTRGNNYYLAIFGVFGIFQVIFQLVFNSLYWTRMVVAAREMHAQLANRLLRAPMSFFETTPIGRILNRVSRDVDTIDNTIPTILRDFILTLGQVIVSMIVVMIETPTSGAVLLPVIVAYYFLQRFYVSTTRQLKRLESVSRSPIYVLFSETLSGTASIRAYGVTQRFIQDLRARVDNNQKYYFAYQSTTRWLQWNLDILAGLVVLAASVFAVGSHSSASGVGLSVSYALQISGALIWMTRQISEFETNIVSVERLTEYSALETEAEWILPQHRPSPSWPESGEIKFINYQTRYRPGLKLVLRGITCTIGPGEKVGVVGRTGAGKSSLTLSLFRLIESAGGFIVIDGTNIADIGLHDLRSRLTILPQDPVLFSGTLRMNLDPFNEYSDEDLWTALDQAHLKDTVTQLPGCLQFKCVEQGDNLSAGQRQLLCLARTLLRKTSILILDEATAAVDMETDNCIQSTIRTAFSGCTVITIAHRLNTIMDYDRILVLDEGLIKEFSPPAVLLADKTSTFYLMARNARLI